MYLNENDFADVNEIVSKNYVFCAHKNDKTGEVESLSEHIRLCKKYFLQIIKSRNLDYVFNSFENECLKGFSNEAKMLFRKLLINVIAFHDMGKINPQFQYYVMNNNSFKNILDNGGIGKRHSKLSAIFYIFYFLGELKSIENKQEMKQIRLFLFLNAYVISRHHGDLNDFWNFVDVELREDEIPEVEFLKNTNLYTKTFEVELDVLRNNCRYLGKYIENVLNDKEIEIYTYTRLVYSLLVASDFYATSNFSSGTNIDYFGDINEINEFYDVYKKTNVFQSICKYDDIKYSSVNKDLTSTHEINDLRCEMFLDAEREMANQIDKDIFFLESPTGSGKSNVSLNLSFRLIEQNFNLNKIFYVYPFNTLVEQNIKSLEKIYGKDKDIFNKIKVVNSIYPIKNQMLDSEEAKEDSSKYYGEILLDRQFLNYPFILTTHVSLFDIMFSDKRESAFGFHQLANSVIVLDEIQSYKNVLWTEIISFLKVFAKILNIKIIIMSATLPNLDVLVENMKPAGSLISDRNKYFCHSLFKDRVKINYDLLKKGKIDEETLLEHVKLNSKKGKKILIEFINRRSAKSFFRKLKEDVEIKCEFELMTGEDSIIERERVLDKIDSKSVNENGIILVATQVVEAGIDIDMDIGYKDISKLDSEEQFMGRINRSCNKEGIVYFFDMDDARKVYSKELRVNPEVTLIEDIMQEILSNKNFEKFYCEILELLKRENYKKNDSNIESFWNNDVRKLNFKEIAKKMELISQDKRNFNVYLERTIYLKTGEKLDGKKLWEEYKVLLNNGKMSYAEKQVKLSQVRSKMNYFIHEVKYKNFNYNENIGELYYIENGNRFFENGKFDAEKFEFSNLIV